MHRYKTIPCPECGDTFDERGLGMHRKKLHNYRAFNQSPPSGTSREDVLERRRLKALERQRNVQRELFGAVKLTELQAAAFALDRWDQAEKTFNTGHLGDRWHLVLHSLVTLGFFERDDRGWRQTAKGRQQAAIIEEEFANA
jgi:hypothetical protein